MAEEGRIGKGEGSTATVILLLNDELYVAYIGDSAAVLVESDNKTFVDLCPELDVAGSNPQEVERIRKLDGVVLMVGETMRVQGELALTRSLGVLKYKPYVTANPHIKRYSLKEQQNSFLVVATDGLWKALDGAAVAKIVSENTKLDEAEIAKKLHDEAIKRNSTDNITIVVVNIEKRQRLQTEEALESSKGSTLD